MAHNNCYGSYNFRFTSHNLGIFANLFQPNVKTYSTENPTYSNLPTFYIKDALILYPYTPYNITYIFPLKGWKGWKGWTEIQ